MLLPTAARLSLWAAFAGSIAFLSTLTAAPSLPLEVPGLARSGLGTKRVVVAVRDTAGRVNVQAQPGITVLKSARWSPNDAEREGASEFEVLLSVARLLEKHPLPGLIGIGNQNGAFLPAAEQALTRAATMGVPVVKLSASGTLASNPENLFIEAGSLSPDEAKVLLAECLLVLGTLPPARNILAPTEAELQAIRHHLARYQAFFDRQAPVLVASR